MVKKLTKEAKKKRKRWITIVASKEFNHVEIGESFCSDPKNLIGKIANINLASLTNDPRKQNIKINFKVSEIKEDKANTEIIAYSIIPAHIKRMTRRARDKIEDSFLIESKDKIRMRIKPLILTRTEAKRSVLATLRKKSREFFIENAKKQNYADIFSILIGNKWQREIKEHLKKIYPVIACEIKILEKVSRFNINSTTQKY